MALNLNIPESELRSRRATLFERLREENDVEAVVLYGVTAVLYTTGFSFIPTERPLGVIFTSDSVTAVVPELEVDHMKATSHVDDVVSYLDYPGPDHPMKLFADTLRSKGLTKADIAVDSDGYGSIYGYRGPLLSELLPEAKLINCRTFLEEIRFIKSSQELKLIEESVKWSNLAHRLLQDYVADGVNETTISTRASLEAVEAMIGTLADEYDPRDASASLPVFAGFRSQIGPNSAFPHAIPKHLNMREGDVLVTGAAALVWGYRSELERTMFVGPPSDEQRKFFELMVGAQDTAFEAIKPGATCADVDRAVRDYYDSNDINKYMLHHTGHAIGIEIHEAPFLDVGDTTTLEPGMVFTVEPGIFVPGLGGFRHSDTVVVTDEGMDFITYYPRDLESMICGV